MKQLLRSVYALPPENRRIKFQSCSRPFRLHTENNLSLFLLILICKKGSHIIYCIGIINRKSSPVSTTLICSRRRTITDIATGEAVTDKEILDFQTVLLASDQLYLSF